MGVEAGAQELQRHPTPEAFELLIDEDDDQVLRLGLVGEIAEIETRVGGYAECDRAEGVLRGGMFFGVFPEGKPVQAAVRGPDGRVERFGPVVVGSPASGFHAPIIEGEEDVVRFVAVFFSTGALASNGHNSIWNRASAADNEEARQRLLVCAGNDSS